MKNLRLVVLAIAAVVTLSGCTSDRRSMWHSDYAFKSVGQVMAMCDDGNTDACYAARDMGALQAAAPAMMQMGQQMQAQAAPAPAPKIVNTTCSRFGNTVNCTSM